MNIVRLDDDYFFEPTPWGTGAAHSVSGEGECQSVVDQLHQVIEEVTGKPVDNQPKRIGFY